MTKTDTLIDRKKAAISNSPAMVHPVFIAKGEGALVWDVEGRKYFDFCGGIGALNVGHCHPKVVAAVRDNADKYLHTCFMVVMYEEYVRLAERLSQIVPIDGETKSIFFNSGSEAVENAVKVSRKYTGRTAVVAFERCFHGRTLLGMSLIGKTKPYKAGLGPFAPEIYRLPYEPFFGHLERSDEAVKQECERAFEKLVSYHIEAENIACLIMEPVLGEGGFYPAHPAAIHAVREFTAKHGIQFVIDEVQSGFGRCGTWFACERYNIRPDLITMAKSLGGGMPISAVTGKKEVMDAPMTGSLGGTYGGSPLACHAALAVLDILEDGTLFKRANAIGERIMTAFAALQKAFPFAGQSNGLGAMCGLEIVHPETGKPWPERAAEIVTKARDLGLLLMTASGNVIRVLVPLVISDADLESALKVLEEAMK